MTDALRCPACDAPVADEALDLVVTCAACGAVAVAVGLDGPPRRMVEPRLGAAEAAAGVRRFLGRGRVRAGTRRRATLAAPRPVWLPFARLEGEVVGWVFGVARETTRQGAVLVDREEQVADAHRAIVPLADPGDGGVYALPDLEGVARVPFDTARAAAHGEVVPALEADATAEARLHAAWQGVARRRQALFAVTGEDLAVVVTAHEVVYYPFWRVDYEVGGARYAVTLDARTGEVAAGAAPGSRLAGVATFAALQPLAAAATALGAVAGWRLAAWAARAFFLDTSLAGLVAKLLLPVGVALIAAGGVILSLGVYLGVRLATAAHRGLRRAAELEEGYGVRPDARLFGDADDDAFRARRAAERAAIAADPRMAP